MLGDELAEGLAEIQAQAESLMVDRCVLRRPIGVTADPETGADVITYAPDPIYTGPGKLQSRTVETLAEQSADSSRTVQRLEVHLPARVSTVSIGDVVELRSRRFRVTGVADKTWLTAQRLPVEELT